MKKTLLTLTSVLLCAITFAQSVPQGINYQAVARDANGDELTNQSLTVKLSVISGNVTGTVSWQETHLVTTNDYGLFTAVIGGGASTSVGSSTSFDVVDWGSASHYLKVEVDDGGGYVDMGTNQLLSVPYALHAGNPGPAIFRNDSNVTSNANGDYATDDFVFGSSTLDWNSNNDHAKRMFFDKSKGAFRVGGSNPAYAGMDWWDEDSLGTWSFASGYGTRATADKSTALGGRTNASGGNSTAMGGWSTASGYASTAMGYYPAASGDYSTAMGYSTEASGYASTAMGKYSIASGYASTAMGLGTEASGDYSTTMGENTKASGSYSTAMGRGIEASGDYSVAIALNDQSNVTLSQDNAMAIMGGNVGVGTVNPNAKLDIHHAGAMIQMENSSSGHQWEFYTGGSAGDDGLGIYDRTNSAYRLAIDNGGNIGIGTTTPSVRLNVDGGSDAMLTGGGYIVTNSISSTNIVIDDNEIMARNNGSESALYLQNDGGDILIGAGAAGGFYGIEVKIGPSNYYTGSTSNILQVAGTIGVEYVPTWNGAGFYDMTWDNSTKTLSKEGSSLRFKKNIKPMEADFSKILQIEPKDYQMREGYGPEGEWVYGYIAEELDQLGLKKLVTYDQEGRPDGIHYKKISMYNLEIIKNQQAIIESQKTEISDMRAEIDGRLKAIEETLNTTKLNK